MVYVDNAFIPFRGMLISHMIADTEEELELMREKIGLKKEWKHNNHY